MEWNESRWTRLELATPSVNLPILVKTWSKSDEPVRWIRPWFAKVKQGPQWPELPIFVQKLGVIFTQWIGKNMFAILKTFTYRKVASSSMSRLVAHFQISRRLMKGKFDAYVLWPLAKKFQNWIVDRSTARDFTVIDLTKSVYIEYFWEVFSNIQ